MSEDDFENLTREEREQRLVELRKERSEMLNELLEKLFNAYNEGDGHLIARAICEGILGIEYDDYESKDPERLKIGAWKNILFKIANFQHAGKEKLVRNRVYADLAETGLFCLEKPKDWKPVYGEYVSLVEWMKKWAHINDNFLTHNYHRLDKVVDTFIAQNESDFYMCMWFAYEQIYHGVPIYTQNSETEEYVMVPFSHDDYVFMRLLGENHMDVRPSQFPGWVKGYFFKTSDLKAHEIFFGGERGGSLTLDEVNTLKTAYHRYIFPEGIPETSLCKKASISNINGPTVDRLLKAIAEFPSKYSAYRTKPPKLDEDVRKWLKAVGYAKNDREAAIFGSIIAEHFKFSGDSQNTQ